MKRDGRVSPFLVFFFCSKKGEVGSQVNFWHDVWLGTISLKESFPILHQVCEDKGTFVEEMREWHIMR